MAVEEYVELREKQVLGVGDQRVHLRNQFLAASQIKVACSDPISRKSWWNRVDLIEIDCLFITHLTGVIPGGTVRSELIEQTHGELVEEDFVASAKAHRIQELNRNGLHFIASTNTGVWVIVESKLEEDIWFEAVNVECELIVVDTRPVKDRLKVNVH